MLFSTIIIEFNQGLGHLRDATTVPLQDNDYCFGMHPNVLSSIRELVNTIKRFYESL